MAAAYLTVEEAAAFGVTATTQQISTASALIDGYLRRPEGLLWVPDSIGQPCYMLGASSDFTFTLVNPIITPGANVVVQLNGPTAMLAVGDVLILDIDAPTLIEAVTIVSTVGPGGAVNITLQSVRNAHAAGATADHGLTIQEKRYMPKRRPITYLSRAPLVNLLSGVGRYAFGRRANGLDDDNVGWFNLLAALTAYGGPPYWEVFQVTTSQNWDAGTGELWIPCGVLLTYYSEVKVNYVAGFPVGELPAAIQSACCQLILAIAQNPMLGAVKSYKAGDTQVTMFAASNISDDVKMMLNPYAVRINV